MGKTRTGKRTTGIRTDGTTLIFLSRALEELTDFSPEADICSYVATTLKELPGHPLTDLSCTIPHAADIRLQTGECDDLPGQLSALLSPSELEGQS